ncbi:MAG: DUF3052 domain-containing protein [Phycisphaerales bacterium]
MRMSAGYSGTPLARKLGIKEGHQVYLIGAPPGFEDTLEGMPPGVSVRRTAKITGKVDVVVAFFGRAAVFRDEFARLKGVLQPAGGLWIAWPKKASGVATDLTEDVVRGFGLEGGLVDNKVCAIDQTWSGLRFVFRLTDRGPKPQEGNVKAGKGKRPK